MQIHRAAKFSSVGFLLCGLFCGQAHAEDERTIDDEVTETIDEREDTPVGQVSQNCDCAPSFTEPYIKRRGQWGMLIQLGASQYEPLNYRPDFAAGQTFEGYYGHAQTPMLEASLGLKYNIDFGSIAATVGFGGYSNSQGRNNTTLSVTPVTFGLTAFLDTLFDEPYVVPYVGGGGALAWYSETLGSQKVSGNTNLGFFYVFGVGIQLDWLDEQADRAGYEEGLENTFAFVEARGFEMSGGRLAELSSPLQIGFGLRFEL